MSLAKMTVSDKLEIAIQAAIEELPPAAAQQAKGLLQPENLAAFAAGIAILATSHAFGIGLIIDGIFLAAAALCIGWAVFSVAANIAKFLEGVLNGVSRADLELAGKCLAEAITAVGVQTVAAVVTRGNVMQMISRATNAGERATNGNGSRRKGGAPSNGEGNGSGAEKIIHGTGPVKGVILLGPGANSYGVFRAGQWRSGVEFVFDPDTNRVALGVVKDPSIPGSWHQKLARAIGADERRVLGGTIRHDGSGRNLKIDSDQSSGHYGHRWTTETRKQFEDAMRQYTSPMGFHHHRDHGVRPRIHE